MTLKNDENGRHRKWLEQKGLFLTGLSSITKTIVESILMQKFCSNGVPVGITWNSYKWNKSKIQGQGCQDFFLKRSKIAEFRCCLSVISPISWWVLFNANTKNLIKIWKCVDTKGSFDWTQLFSTTSFSKLRVQII